MHKPRVSMGKISYINASPVYYGLDRGLCPDWLEMVPEVPAVLNHRLKTGEIQLSPISAAYYAMNHEDLLLLPDLSISCNGPVISVLLASHLPLDALDGKKVIFSRESASAAAFMRMIFHQRGIVPDYLVGDVAGDVSLSKTVDAALVIGDAALVQPWNERFAHLYDLGEIWYEMTAMPFVFAVWAVRRDFAKAAPGQVREILDLLLASKAQGYSHMDEVVRTGSLKLGIDEDTIRNYYNHLFCDMDAPKINAMQQFFDNLAAEGILKEKMQLAFFR